MIGDGHERSGVTVLDVGELYHHGVRVPDLDEAMDELGSALGLEWCSVQTSVQSIWMPETGTHEVPLRFTYSRQGPVHLELLEGAPGSLWDGRVQPGLHHVGLWCDDVRSATETAVDGGWEIVMSQAEPDKGYGAFVYVRPPSGLIVELVWSGIKPMFERWFAGGPLR